MTSVLFYLVKGTTDDDLSFNNFYLPDELSSRIKSHIPDIFFSVPEEYSGKLKSYCNIHIRKNIDDARYWKSLFAEIKSDHVIKIFCDSPFMDTDIINEMLGIHTQYLAEYTYSENLPSGCSCEIISKELIDALPDNEGMPLSQIIRSNINKFDVELYYKEPDIRDKRLAFRNADPRENQIMRNIYSAHGGFPSYPQLKEIIDRNPGVLYLSPSYIEIELTGRCDLDCVFCYRNILKPAHGDMEPAVFKKIISDMSEFAMPYSVCLGGSGEPLMHGNFFEMLDVAVNDKLVKTVVVETNGVFADTNYKNYLMRDSHNVKKIKTIFNVNGFDKDTYLNIHKKDCFETVYQNINGLKDVAAAAPDSLYIQIMKINETENYLDKYYDFWDKLKIPVILQKQNTYLGRIQDRRYSDLTPLDRTPCWHLQRDLTIPANGSIAFCKQDIEASVSTCNVNDMSIKHAWDKRKDMFIRDYNKQYPVKPDCKKCDEWYTFNL